MTQAETKAENSAELDDDGLEQPIAAPKAQGESISPARFAELSGKAQALLNNINSVLVGQQQAVRLAVIAFLSGGHVLIEDVPGVGKTLMAKTLAMSVTATFKRVQCTPDLLPSDVCGVSIFEQKEGTFKFIPGPIFTNILLADEINRATPRTQSSLLEAMEEIKSPQTVLLASCLNCFS